MNLEHSIVETIARKQSKEIDEIIFNFLEDNGYKNIRSMDEFEKNNLIKKWQQEDKQLRVETFLQPPQQIQQQYKYKSITIPFFDSISHPITRREIYDNYKLEDKGYLM